MNYHFTESGKGTVTIEADSEEEAKELVEKGNFPHEKAEECLESGEHEVVAVNPSNSKWAQRVLKWHFL